ncbi:hypothetical protein [Meiothermus sp.]
MKMRWLLGGALLALHTARPGEGPGNIGGTVSLGSSRPKPSNPPPIG